MSDVTEKECLRLMASSMDISSQKIQALTAERDALREQVGSLKDTLMNKAIHIHDLKQALNQQGDE